VEVQKRQQGDEQMSEHAETFKIYPIGRVRRGNDGIYLEIDEPFRPALKQLDHFSHVMVFWWADWFDNEEWRNNLQSRPPYAEEHLIGVFATRAPYRPNPIAMTTCKVLGMDEPGGLVQVADVDAIDGTRIVDLKAYFPVCDRVREAHIPEWLSDWPDWMPENGTGLEEGEG
jgi:tRNA-Thr(GGU) m(6)t(6)A37 methyltransferase TsaA